MAFTEAALTAQLDPDAMGRTITIERYIVGPTTVDVYAVGVTAPFAGRSRWVVINRSDTAAKAATDIQAALTA